MGDLEFGFEEMQGVKLGYLVIQGKQMFALSQVFTDLLKNIPRTTVHKRMDHLNVKKHHCDLEELRKLKAINSVAFHAAKCTLISREDVEALYFSCKTERVLKSNKKKTKPKPERRLLDEDCLTPTRNMFWKDKLWLSFRGVSPELSSNLPQIYSKSIYKNFQPLATSACKAFKNYETTKIQKKSVEFSEKSAFFCNAEISRFKPVVSAISAPSDAELLYKRKRRSEKQVSCRKRRCRPLLLVPKCCKPKACLYNGSLSRFYPDREIFLERHFQESCSSDSECSSDNDSDFGSSFSSGSSSCSSSNSDSSEDEDEESMSCSSESSDSQSSSQSDSSSVSSRVSRQSIRFRTTSLNAKKTPQVLQPTFQYRSNFLKNGTLCEIGAASDRQKGNKAATLDTTTITWKQRHCDVKGCDCGRKLNTVENGFSGLKRVDFSKLPKTTELVTVQNASFTSCPDGNVFRQQRAFEHKASMEKVTRAPESCLSEGANCRKDAKTANCLKQPSPLKQVKTELEEVSPVSETTGTKLHHVKIKVEENDEYEYATQSQAFHCNGKSDTFYNGDDLPGGADRSSAETDRWKGGRKTTPSPKEEPRNLLNVQEHKHGVRVRKSQRTPGWGKKIESVTKPSLNVTEVDRSPRSAGKCASKRAANSLPSKPAFTFMENFPCPPSLMIGSDGDLIPAYSLNSFRTSQVPHQSHPVWRWQLGASVIPPNFNQTFRKTMH